jgi:hypothetical protein
MSALFGGGQQVATPTPTPAPPPPSRSDTEIQAAGAAQRARFWGSQGGRAATELTGGTGADSGSAVVRLLGNVGR